MLHVKTCPNTYPFFKHKGFWHKTHAVIVSSKSIFFSGHVFSLLSVMLGVELKLSNVEDRIALLIVLNYISSLSLRVGTFVTTRYYTLYLKT
jgi:hypothetical protein